MNKYRRAICCGTCKKYKYDLLNGESCSDKRHVSAIYVCDHWDGFVIIDSDKENK